ncbi:hypothetical protein AB0I81_19980 [Nonomuraea sp. NPDC050404]|uniref:hypothetical protein n=1 Tax=Nonomuraea sp. NPDC050404 TaxID=3155783 RepID=UPI0033F5205D
MSVLVSSATHSGWLLTILASLTVTSIESPVRMTSLPGEKIRSRWWVCPLQLTR